jgi:hypothetical protein
VNDGKEIGVERQETSLFALKIIFVLAMVRSTGQYITPLFCQMANLYISLQVDYCVVHTYTMPSIIELV